MSEFDVLSPKRCTSETVIVSSVVRPAELSSVPGRICNLKKELTQKVLEGSNDHLHEG